MDCPCCSTPLRECRYKGTVIDECPKCRGAWFGGHKLNPTIHYLAESEAGLPSPQVEPHRSVVSAEQVKEGDRACPRCGVAMGKFNYAYDSNIFVDRCPQCHGVWADAGEKRRLAVFTQGNPKVERMARDLAEYEERRLAHQSQMADARDLNRPISPLTPRVVIALPLSTDLERRGIPGVTIGLIVLNTLIFVLCDLASVGHEAIFAVYGLTPQQIWAGELPGTLVTYMFLHAGLWHLVCNMFFLWLFGGSTEDAFGHIRHLVCYLACGLGGAALHVLTSPMSALPCVGASGAISGVMGAYFVLYPSSPWQKSSRDVRGSLARSRRCEI